MKLGIGKWTLIGVILLTSIGMGVLYIYGSRNDIPAGMDISGWKPTGISRIQFQEELKMKLRILSGQQMMLKGQNGEEKRFTLEQLGISWNVAVLDKALAPLWEGSFITRAQARWNYDSVKFKLHPLLDRAKLDNKVKEAWQEMYKVQPLHAKRMIDKEDQVLYSAGLSAYRVNMEQLEARLLAIVPGKLWSTVVPQPEIIVDVPFVEIKPAVTLEQLKAEGIVRKIAEFSTPIQSDAAGRLHNLQAAAMALNDAKLAPGEILDYAKIVAEANKKFGFKEAPVIVNGMLVPGVGGGICQISSTLYMAALLAGQDIVERHHHSLLIRYMKPGQDATFASGYLNFRFRNSSNTHVLIRSEAVHGQVVVKIFGTLPDTVRYEVESDIVMTLEAPVEYVYDSTLLPGEEKVLQKGTEGYVVLTYRTKWTGGEDDKRTLVSRDRYKPKASIIAVNDEQFKKEQSNEINPPGKELNPPGKSGETIIEDGLSLVN